MASDSFQLPSEQRMQPFVALWMFCLEPIQRQVPAGHTEDSSQPGSGCTRTHSQSSSLAKLTGAVHVEAKEAKTAKIGLVRGGTLIISGGCWNFCLHHVTVSFLLVTLVRGLCVKAKVHTVKEANVSEQHTTSSSSYDSV